MTTRSLAVLTATVGALRRSTNYSTSGTMTASVKPSVRRVLRYGTVDWLFREYRISKAYLDKVAPRSRPDYERTMLVVADLLQKGNRIGSLSVRSITPRAADKLYVKIIHGKKGLRLRQGEKAVALCRKAWKVVRRLYPDDFDNLVPNPWDGVTRRTRTKKRNQPSLGSRFMRSHGGALNAVAQTPPLPQLFVLNGYSGRKMYSPDISDGQTIAARNGPTPLELSIIRPVRGCCIRWKRQSAG